MKTGLLIGGFSSFVRELMRWIWDILGFGLGVACIVILVVGALPEDGMREQRSVGVWGARNEGGQSWTMDLEWAASAKNRNSDSIAQYDRHLE